MSFKSNLHRVICGGLCALALLVTGSQPAQAQLVETLEAVQAVRAIKDVTFNLDLRNIISGDYVYAGVLTEISLEHIAVTDDKYLVVVHARVPNGNLIVPYFKPGDTVKVRLVKDRDMGDAWVLKRITLLDEN